MENQMSLNARISDLEKRLEEVNHQVLENRDAIAALRENISQIVGYIGVDLVSQPSIAMERPSQDSLYTKDMVR